MGNIRDTMERQTDRAYNKLGVKFGKLNGVKKKIIPMGSGSVDRRANKYKKSY